MKTSCDRRDDFAIRGLLLLACSIIAVLLAVLLPDGKPFAAQGFNWYVNAGQHNLFAARLAYAFFCLAISAAAFMHAKFRGQLSLFSETNAKLIRTILVLTLGFFGLASICFYAKDLSVSISTAVVCVVVINCIKFLPGRATVILSISLTILVLLVTVVPGLSSVPDYSWNYPESIADIESHQAVSIAADQRLAQGMRLFESVGSRYGVLWQSLLGAWTKLVGPLTVGDGIMFTRWLQSIFFFLAAVAYLKFARRTALAACVAVLFIAPWMELRQMLFIFPQVTAWRYTGFVVAPLLVMALERIKSPFAPSLLLGATAALALLSDFASGSAVTAGLFAYLVFRRDNLSIARSLMLFLGGMLAAFAVYFCLFAFIFGYIPSLKAGLSELKMTLWDCAGGTAPALGYQFDPLAILILIHTSYGLLKLLAAGPRSLALRDALRLCIYVISLCWFVHYVNEPNTYALRACRVLYGFLLIDLLRTLILTWKSKRERAEPVWVLNLILVSVIIPAAALSYKPAAERMFVSRSQDKGPEKMLVSGVYLSDAVGKALLEKAQFIAKAAANGPVVYITADGSFVPKLAGVSSLSPLTDPYSELIFSRQSEMYIQAINKLDKKMVYVDAPDFITAQGVSRRSCLEYLRVLLARTYVLTDSQSGWQIWVLKDKNKPI